MYLIRLNSVMEASPLTLTPGGVFVGFGNALMVPSSGPGETIEQEIDVQFSGTPAQIQSACKLLSACVENAAAQAEGPMSSPYYLEVQVSAGEAIYRSLVYDGRIEWGATGLDTREYGDLSCKLRLVRANWWEASTEVKIIDNALVTNHRDGGHSNVAYKAGDAADDWDLPSTARVVFSLDTAITGAPSLFAGLRSNKGGGNLDLFREGQEGAAGAGVTGTTVSNADSSDGSYMNLAWSGASAVRLWYVDLDAVNLTMAKGYPFRIVARIADGGYASGATEALWHYWEIAYVDGGGVERVIYQTPGGYLPTLREMILGPVVYLPPWALPYGTSSPQLRVSLKGQAAGSGAHALKLDYVDMCPVTGWRYYKPVLKSYTLSVDDAGGAGMGGPAGGVVTHTVDGPPFLLQPRCMAQFQFYLFWAGAAGQVASANLAGHVTVYHRPRRRNL